MSAGYKQRSLALTRTLDGSQFKVESRRPLAAPSFACYERILSPAVSSTYGRFNVENVTRMLGHDLPNWPMFQIFTIPLSPARYYSVLRILLSFDMRGRGRIWLTRTTEFAVIFDE